MCKKMKLIIMMMMAVLFAHANQEIYLASSPALSPNGKEFVFFWQSQIFKSNINGGLATQITFHPGGNAIPHYSHDGKTLFFTSGREDGWQIYSMPIDGGDTVKHTFHTEGYTILDVFPDDKSLLASVWRSYNGLIGRRLVRVWLDGSKRDELIFDDYASAGNISPDGKKMLIVREGNGISDYRKGYLGSTVSQIWLYDMESKKFTSLLQERWGNRTPLWKPDGQGFYYTSEEDGSYNIWEYDLASANKKQLTKFTDSPILIPSLSADGKTLLFRHMFDFYAFNPVINNQPKVIKVFSTTTELVTTYRRWFDKIWNEDDFGSMEFTKDGLEVAFTTGGDLYITDTVLRNPVKIDGASGDWIFDLAFSPDFKTIYYLKDTGDAVNIWQAQVTDSSKYWWQNSEFKITQLTNEKNNLLKLSVSPDGKKLAYFKNRGTLCVSDTDGKNELIIKDAPYSSSYIWGPDSKHLLASMQASSHNANVWILTADNSAKPYNLSRTPSWSGLPSWSPDGKMITYMTRTTDNKLEFNWLLLNKEDDEQTAKDRTLKQALEAMEKVRGKREEKIGPNENDNFEQAPVEVQLQGHPNNKIEVTADEELSQDSDDKAEDKKADDNSEETKTESLNIVIDYNNLHARVHRRQVDWSGVWGFFWSWDSKSIAFCGNAGGKQGTHRIDPKVGNLTPHLLSNRTGWYAKWVKEGSRILWMYEGQPAHLNTSFPVQVYQTINRKERQAFEFRYIWRAMRDNFCDPTMKFIDWDSILKKYEEKAAEAPDKSTFDRLVGMLLGELNASHLGFYRSNRDSEWKSGNWAVETASFGVNYDHLYQGNGLKIAKVLTNGPADLDRSRLNSGDIITHINDIEILPATNVDKITTNRPGTEYNLTVKDADNNIRSVRIKSINFNKARELVQEQNILDRRDIVEKLSEGKFGYINIEQMNNPSLRRFENEIYSQGFDKEGLIIDVRNNPGGFTSDYLLAILCHPQHAVTIPRGGNISYPDGYLPNVVWQKPIVVLCNQYSCSNAEIFSHAIKTLKRGKLVGIETQACVISTPRKKIFNIGTLNVPDRSWWPLSTLVDMEKQGAVPDYSIWPYPGDMPKGIDRQLEKAIEVLFDDVKNQPPAPKLIYQGHSK